MVLPETEAANFLSCDMDKSIKLWENFAISNVLCRFYRFISWIIIVPKILLAVNKHVLCYLVYFILLINDAHPLLTFS